MIDPRAAVANLKRLAEIGAQGRYGFYEALDYTPARLPEGESVAIVHAFMAHHQGMTIVAIADALLDGAMRARFHAEPIVKATELLLQERMPRDVAATRLWASDVKSLAEPATSNRRAVGGSPPRFRLRRPRTCSRTAATQQCSPLPARDTAAGAIWR